MEQFTLDFNNIMDASELFTDDADNNVETGASKTETPEDNDKEENNFTAEEITAEMFVDPESVGGEDATENNGGTTEQNAGGSSPKNTYSSIASAFKIDGVPLFSDADNEELGKLESTDAFEDFLKTKLEETVQSRIDDVTKRVNDALTYGMNPTEIQIFENSIRNLNTIKDEDVEAETEEGENLRRYLIQTDYLNKGYSEAVAKKKTQQSFDANTDLEDAKDALSACKTFYQSEYDKAFAAQKAEYDKGVAKMKADADKLRKDILEGKDAFGGAKVDDNTRKKIFDAIAKPIGKDAEGRTFTAIQKYADEHPVDFRKNLAYFFVMTDGFKSLDKIKESVKNEVTKKQISALEQALNSTARNDDGSLKYFYPSGATANTGGTGWQIEL